VVRTTGGFTGHARWVARAVTMVVVAALTVVGLTVSEALASPVDAGSVTVEIAPASVSTVAGNDGSSVVNGLGAAASFANPRGFHLVNGFGYVFDDGYLRRVELSTGAVTTVAGTGTGGYSDSADPSQARVGGSGPMADDGSYLYFAQGCGYYGEYSCVRQMSLTTGAITTIDQRGYYSGFNALAVASDGQLYGTSGDTVTRIDTATHAASTAAVVPGNGLAGLHPTVTAMTADGGDLWLAVSDGDNYGNTYGRRVVRLDVVSGTSSSLPAGDGQATYSVLASAGSYLYAVSGSRIVRFTKSTGASIAIAGQPNGLAGYVDGIGSQAWFGTVTGLESDGTRLFVTDQGNRRIRQLSAASTLGAAQSGLATTTVSVSPGSVSSVAGNDTSAVTNGVGPSASFKTPRGMHVIGQYGYLFDDGYLRRVNLTSGAVTNVAGTGTSGYADSTNPMQATVNGLGPMADDGSFLYFTNGCGYYAEYSCVRRMSLSTGAISTVDQRSYSSGFSALTVGGDGQLYGTSGGTVTRFDIVNNTTATVATIPASVAGQYPGISAMAADGDYLWLAVSDGNYYGNLYNPRVVRLNPATGETTSFPIGAGQTAYSILASAGDYLYGISGSRVVRFTKASGSSVVIAGQPTTATGYVDGVGSQAWFGTITGLESDGTRLLVTDQSNHRVRQLTAAATLPASQAGILSKTVSISPALVRTFAGNDFPGVVSGQGTSASFASPRGFHVIGHYGYVFDDGYLRRIDLTSGAVTNVAGTGASGYSDSNDPSQAKVNGLGPMADDGTFLYFTNGCGYYAEYSCLRRMSLATGAIITIDQRSWSDGYTSLVTGPSGALYGTHGASVDKIDTVGSTVSTFLTLPPSQISGHWPIAGSLTADSDGLWVSTYFRDYDGNESDAAVIQVDATTATVGASLSVPRLTVAASAGAYLYGVSGHAVVRVSKATGAMDTITGQRLADPGYVNGTGSQSAFGTISGLESDGAHLFVTDTTNRRVRVLVQGTPLTSTVGPAIPVGPILVGESAGGANDSENCPQRCHKDPVNSVTGEFWLSVADLQMTGTGPALALVRSFSTERKDLPGVLGNGWTSNYDISLAISSGASGSNLSAASSITVKQENGSTVTFNRSSTGNYTAPPRVLATLSQGPGNTFVFSRQKRQTFTFDPSGKLQSISDANGNTIGLQYSPNGHLIRAHDEHGRTIEFTWDGDRISAATDQSGRVATYAYSAAGDLVEVTNVVGSTTSYAYDGYHRIVDMSAPDGGVTHNAYDIVSRVVAQTDPLGRVTLFDYGTGQSTITDPSGEVTTEEFVDGRVISETKASGTPLAQTTTYTYDPTNQVESMTDALGRVTHFTYDADGNRTSVIDPLGRTSSTTYDDLGNPLVVTNAAGEVTSFEYDEHGNLISTAASDGAITTYIINPTGTVASIADALGHVTALSYDAYGFAIATVAPDGSTMSSDYDALGNRLSVTSPLGNEAGAEATAHTTTYSYDGMGRPLTTTDPLGATSSLEYDAAGRVVSTTNAAGETSTSIYDLAGQLTLSTDAAGRTTSFEYNAAGRIVKVTDPAGAQATTAYDLLGRVTSQTDPTGRATIFEYDAGNRVMARVAPSGARTTYAYDAADQLLSTTDALGHVSTTTYDDAGRPVTVTDADGRAITTTYDPAGRVIGALRGDGSELTWAYDAVGQLAHTTDAAGTESTFSWDDLGRKTTYTDTAGRTTSYGYDADGRITTQTQPGGAVTTFSYDAAGHLTGTGYSDTTPDVATKYDKAGRVTQVEDGTGTTTYARDALGRVTAVDREGTVLGYGYDTAGRVAALTYPNGDQVQRGFDAAGRLASVTDWAGRTFNYTYDADGDLATLVYPNGVETTYNHDITGKTLTIATEDGSGQDLLTLAYGYTDAGLLSGQSTTRPGAPRGPPNSDTTKASSFSWDPLGRLAEVVGDSAGAVGYNPAGSVTSLTDGRSLAYDSSRQVTSLINPAANTTTGYTYDSRGNRATATTTSLSGVRTVSQSFDQANHLTSITADGSTTAYTYDASGLRATGETATSTEHFLWDAQSSVAQLIADARYAYVYGLGAAPLEQVDSAGGTVDYLHTDVLGSVRTTTNSGGAVTWDVDYDSYGVALASGGAAPSAITKFGYAGEYTDANGYIYLRNRFYDPTSAQFISVDPLVQTTGDPYGYAGGNPLQATDPLGLTWWKPATWTAATWDNLSIGLAIAGVVVTATGIGAPIGAALIGLSMAANAGSVIRNYQDGNCVAAAIGLLGFVPGFGKLASKVGGAVLTRLASRALTHAAEHGAEVAVESAASRAGAATRSGGNDYATDVLSGGRPDGQTVFAGHGEYKWATGDTVVPEGTTVNVYADFGETISQSRGLSIEQGLGVPPVTTFGPGDVMPNYDLLAPAGLTVMSDSITVGSRTALSDLLRPNMGVCHWAACTSAVR
jgi:RHS repeat-associated protein